MNSSARTAIAFDAAERGLYWTIGFRYVTFDRDLGGVEKTALAMRRGGVGWYPSSHFIHLDSGPTRSWVLDGSGFDRLLIGGNLDAPPRQILTVRQRMARLQASARREKLLRK